MTRIAKYIDSQRYKSLLVSLMLLIFVPFFANGPLQQVITTVCLSLVFIISVGAVSRSRNFYIRLIIVVVLMIVLDWVILLLQESGSLRIIAYALYLVFMTYVIHHLFKYILSNRVVDFEIIMAALSIYLLMGVIGALLAGIIDLIYPQAFNISTVDSRLLWTNFLYYSFVTLTTLGYGDITPVIEESKALAIWLSIIGPFYLATVIAILISNFDSSTRKVRKSKN